MLKLIVNNIDPLYESALSQSAKANLFLIKSPLQNSFLIDFRQVSQNLYLVRVHDFYHQLSCEMTLELKESFAFSKDGTREKYLAPIMECNFPSIDVRRFHEKVYWDEYLQGTIMVQFQLKILEQLLLFFEEKDATHLILTMNDDYLEIYRPFALLEEKVIMSQGEQTEIIMTAGLETYDKVIDFMDEFDADFQKTLWRNQKMNPDFRKYLIDHSLSVQQ